MQVRFQSSRGKWFIAYLVLHLTIASMLLLLSIQIFYIFSSKSSIDESSIRKDILSNKFRTNNKQNNGIVSSLDKLIAIENRYKNHSNINYFLSLLEEKFVLDIEYRKIIFNQKIDSIVIDIFSEKENKVHRYLKDLESFDEFSKVNIEKKQRDETGVLYRVVVHL